jgi:hypothetical protein
MKSSPQHHRSVRVVFAVSLIAFLSRSLSALAAGGVPQPDVYAALLKKAEAGTLQINHGDTRPESKFFLARMFAPKAAKKTELPADFFSGSFRSGAKTSFSTARVQSFATLDALFGPLPEDKTMTQQFPKLLTSADTARVAPEKRSVKVNAFIYWIASEDDRDFHVVLGSTPTLTTTTVFMNSEISGLPPSHPTRVPFPQRRVDIRAILKNHKNVKGLFVMPVPVTMTGSLFWDGEHRFPNNVGPEVLRPTKAWEIHPIKLLAER